jgi:hypothetical protein
MDLKQSIKAIKREYPNATPFWYAEYKGKLFVSVGDPKIPEQERLLDVHEVDQKTFKVSGTIPVMRLFADPDFQEALAHSKPIEAQNFLAHHGIKGQKWGVRNGPPYPLDAKTHKEVTSEKPGSGRKEGVAELLLPLAPIVSLAALTLAEKVMAKHLHDKDWKDQQVTIAKSSTELKDKGIADTDVEFSSENPPKKIKGDHDIDADLQNVNPTYDEKNEKTCQNCVLCSTTYDMRRRGYDVTARLTNKPLYTEEVLKTCYNGVKKDDYSKCRTFDAVEKKIMSSYGEGSRGVVTVGGVYMGMWFGHAMSFEVSNGKVMVLDAQVNQKYSSFGEIKQKVPNSIMNFAQPELSHTYRLDNLDVNMKGMNLACAQRTSKKS